MPAPTPSRVVPVVLGLALLAGCTSVVDGRATAGGPAPSSSPAASSSSSAGTRAPALPPVVTPPPPRGVGTILEAHRIASVTSLVTVPFAERTDSCFPSGPVTSAEAVDTLYIGDGETQGVLETNGFVAGWGQCGQDAENAGTITLVLELADPDAAVRAADALAANAAQDADYEDLVVATPGARAALRSDDAGDTVQAWLPVGRMLAYLFHDTAAGQGAADADRALADQAGLLAGFVPTPQDQVPALPVDPLGIRGLAITPPGDLRTTSGPYDLEGYLRLAIDPARERELLLANGFAGYYGRQSSDDSMSYAVSLYVFPSSTQSNAAYDGFAELEQAAYGGTPFTSATVPAAPCFSFTVDSSGSGYQRCYVGYGSHLASVDVLGLDDPADTTAMDALLPQQRDLIDG